MSWADTTGATDLLVALDHGRVVEQGTHQQLMGGHYAELYDLQDRGIRSS